MPRRAADRFTIASFPQPVQLDPDFAENTWTTLKHAITEINKRNTSNLSFEQLYRYSYNMVLHKHGDFLYSHLTALQTQHIRSVAQQISNTDSPAFLSEIQRQWSWFELSLAHVRDVLMYMDRHYVKTHKKKTVYELGISLFRQFVIENNAILPRLSETLLATIDRERNGESIDTILVRSVTRMLAQLGDTNDGGSVYAAVFEDAFLERTRQFYAREATLFLAETTCSDYLHKASQRIHEERSRVEQYLEPQTAPKVRQFTERELISKYMTKLIDMENSGLISMLRNDRLADLRLMYTLFRDIDNGAEVLRSHLKKEVLERGSEIVQDPDNVRDPFSLITAVLGLKEKYDVILNSAFTMSAFPNGTPTGMYVQQISVTPVAGSTGSVMAGSSSGMHSSVLYASAGNTLGMASDVNIARGGASSSGAGSSAAVDVGSSSSVVPIATGDPDKKFVCTVNEAFERFINSFADAAEYLSLYIDKLLRKDFKGSSDDEIEAKLDSVMTLFRYLSEKDAFQRYFQQHLTKRLLHARSASSEAERSFISKMKTECGYMYTTKMEVMFNDMKTSDETTMAFKEKVARESINMGGVDTSVSVLTTMSWPISSTAKINLPPRAVECTKRFEEFYYAKHEGRRLTWQMDLGTADIRARFDSGTRVVDFASVPAYSMCVLMLFNDKDTLTYAQIRDATGIPEVELIRHLQSLSLSKYRVLRKESRDKDVMAGDRFTFNDEFQCRARRIKLQVITARKENETERNQTRSRIDDDRRPVIDTVIVRIMKNRKVLEHNKLMMEVTNMLSSRFEPNPQEIKKRIESLVEREYLERQEDKRQIYQYVA